jgi:hypothetical protein
MTSTRRVEVIENMTYVHLALVHAGRTVVAFQVFFRLLIKMKSFVKLAS